MFVDIGFWIFDDRRAMLETLLREMDEEGMGEDSGETVVHDSEQARQIDGYRTQFNIN